MKIDKEFLEKIKDKCLDDVTVNICIKEYQRKSKIWQDKSLSSDTAKIIIK